MRQVIVSSPGGPETLKLIESPVPLPRANEVLVRVHAAGVNRPDVLQRQGKYPLPKDAEPGPGLEVSGEIVAVGSEVSSSHLGEHVCGLTNGGGYAEYCRFPIVQSLPIPKPLNAIAAAALPETCFTVWANLFQMGRAKAGEIALIHGGTSGIGTTAIQLLRAFGIRAWATAGSAEKCEALKEMGAEIAINYRQEDFAEVIQEASSGWGVDLILDIIGADYFERNLRSLAREGRLILIAFLSGSKASNIDLAQIMSRKLTITGSTMRPRSTAEKAAIAAELLHHVWPRIESCEIAPIIHATFPLADAAKAHELMESSAHIGKIVLQVL